MASLTRVCMLGALILAAGALAQDTPPMDAPPQPAPTTPTEPPPASPPSTPQTPPPSPTPAPTEPPAQAQPQQPVTQPQAPLEAAPAEPQKNPETPPAEQVPPEVTQKPRGPMIDGHLREGAFLSGPGSLTFILHHTIMAAAAGLATQGIANDFALSLSSRESMLAGTLVGAGLGFATSAWWQFNHWIGTPAASYGIVNSVFGGMFLAGVTDLFTDDPLALGWMTFIGAEAGAWLTATIGGGEMPNNHGLLIASGGGWGLAYSALLLAILGTTGSHLTTPGIVDTLFITAGASAGALALTTARYNPTTAQILRADIFGAGVGGAVLVLSALVLGFDFTIPTPYVLSLLSSAGAIAAVSLLWEESAERNNTSFYYRPPERDAPYACVWW